MMSGTKNRRRPQKNGVTIQDIARRAGVSTATVSRTLATPEQVSRKFRDRVLQVVAETGYTPNLLARNLRAQRAMTILVVVPNVANAFWPEVLRGIDDEMVAEGYDVIIGNLDNLIEREARYVNLAASGQVDGVLILSGRVPAGPDRSMEDLGIPMVSVAAAIPGLDAPHIVVNDRESSASVADHLLALGHRRFGYVCGPEGNINDTERKAGFVGRLREAGIPDQAITAWPGAFSFATGVRAGEAFLAMDDRPTAVFAASDEAAISFMKTVRTAGLDVPDDVSIVGFDGIANAAFTVPTLTTVHQPRREIGQTAARSLLDLMAGRETPTGNIVLKAPLIVEASTGPAPPEAA